ncbi:MAG TPA: hypothetical protein VHB79_06385 [Polyangiaceae bacterium]|nr:hypothetical protein [Polyangiaceae bacterium]
MGDLNGVARDDRRHSYPALCDAQLVNAVCEAKEHFKTRIESKYEDKKVGERTVIVAGDTTRKWDE